MQQKQEKQVFRKVSSGLFRAARRTCKYFLPLAFFFLFSSVAHADPSQSCQDVNSFWSGGVKSEGVGDDIYNSYSFDAGEKLSWTVSFTGTAASNEYAGVSIETYNHGLPLNADNRAGNATISSSFVFSDDDNADLALFSDNSSGTLNNSVTLVLTCTVASSDSTLSALSLSSGTLTPGFSSAGTNYTATVANTVSSISVTPTASDVNASIAVNGVTVASGTASSSIPLNVGPNTITIIVIPEYGSTKTYAINVTRSDPPVITSVSPTSGSTNGGTSVSITGMDLSSITSVNFGTKAGSTVTINSATSISVTTPAHAAGAVDVVISDGTNTPTLPGAFTYNAATLIFSPAAGNLTSGTVGTSYSQTITASGGTASYSYGITSGSLPTGLSFNTTTGIISGTPSASGSYSFTITATDANNVTSAAAYSLAIAVQAPVANAVSATVAANSSSNTIALNITGGTATSVDVASPAGHGTATASGTGITYTPTAGYSGADSFTYTAQRFGHIGGSNCLHHGHGTDTHLLTCCRDLDVRHGRNVL